MKFENIKTSVDIYMIAKEALRNRLYIDNESAFWVWLHNPCDIKKITTCRDDGKLIGVAVMMKHPDIRFANGVNIGVYVKYTYRCRGIGSKLIKMLPNGKSNKRLFWGTGIKDSDKFFKSLPKSRKTFNLIRADGE